VGRFGPLFRITCQFTCFLILIFFSLNSRFQVLNFVAKMCKIQVFCPFSKTLTKFQSFKFYCQSRDSSYISSAWLNTIIFLYSNCEQFTYCCIAQYTDVTQNASNMWAEKWSLCQLVYSISSHFYLQMRLVILPHYLCSKVQPMCGFVTMILHLSQEKYHTLFTIGVLCHDACSAHAQCLTLLQWWD